VLGNRIACRDERITELAENPAVYTVTVFVSPGAPAAWASMTDSQ
jgi:hypothetical protein